MNNRVIYTCITGEYDKLTQPNVINDRFDYICFVKKGTKTADNIGIWQIKELDFDHENNIVLSRYPKLMPHMVLQNYDYSLWIDGNITINDNFIYDVLEQKIKDNITFSGVKHGARDCIYDEAIACIDANKDKFKNILAIVKHLKRNNFPKHFGLNENNVIFRQHNDSKIIAFSEMWWSLFMTYSKRDQLSGMFCLKTHNIPLDYLLPNGANTRNHFAFCYIKHNPKEVKLSLLDKGLIFIKRIFKHINKIKVLFLKISLRNY